MKKKILNASPGFSYKRIALRTTVIYMVLSFLWILFSDQLVIGDRAMQLYISTGKGWFYTIVVGIFIYAVISRELRLRYEAEEKASTEQKILRATIESANGVGIMIVDRNCRYINFNKLHEAMMKDAFGVTIEVGMNVLGYIKDETLRKKRKADFDKAFDGQNHSTLEKFGGKHPIFWETKYSPIIDDDKQIVGATAFSINVTAREQADDVLKSKIAEIEQLNKFMVGRELKMADLKKNIEELKKKVERSSTKINI